MGPGYFSVVAEVGTSCAHKISAAVVQRNPPLLRFVYREISTLISSFPGRLEVDPSANVGWRAYDGQFRGLYHQDSGTTTHDLVERSFTKDVMRMLRFCNNIEPTACIIPAS